MIVREMFLSNVHQTMKQTLGEDIEMMFPI